MIKPIRIYGDQVLEQVCMDVVDFTSSEIKNLVRDLLDTCHAIANSAGLAAPQIGVLKRIAVVRTEFDGDDTDAYVVLINPRIVSQSGLSDDQEGCLSIPGHRDKVARPDTVTVQYQDEHSEVQTIKGTGFFARALVHEIDHLDGRLFIHYFGAAYCLAVKEWLGRQSKEEPVEKSDDLPAIPVAEFTEKPKTVAEWGIFPEGSTEASTLPEASFVQAQGPENDLDDDTSGEITDHESRLFNNLRF